MRNIVLLLGAGASYDHGVPLMKDFYSLATSIYVREKSRNDKLASSFNLVFDFMDRLQKSQAKANINLHNVESVFTALEMAKLLKLDDLKGGRANSWQALEDAMKYFLTKCIEYGLSLPNNSNFSQFTRQSSSRSGLSFIGLQVKKKPIEDVMLKLKQLKNTHNWKVTIITFNYDLIPESILGGSGIEVNYCLPDDNWMPSNKAIKILKLHGSINWYESESKSTSRVKPIVSSPIYQVDRIINRNDNTTGFRWSDGKIISAFSDDHEKIPYVIPPVWNKSNQHQKLQPVWREAANELSQASHIYTLGYSLPDTDGFFKQLFALGTTGNLPLQEFAVFDVELDDVPNGVNSRFRNLLGRGAENVYTYSSGGASSLFKHLEKL